MGNLAIESINGGSIAKICGGQTIIDEKDDKIVMPPKANKEVIVSNKEEDFITIKLILNREIEENQPTR